MDFVQLNIKVENLEVKVLCGLGRGNFNVSYALCNGGEGRMVNGCQNTPQIIEELDPTNIQEMSDILITNINEVLILFKVEHADAKLTWRAALALNTKYAVTDQMKCIGFAVFAKMNTAMSLMLMNQH